MPGATTDAKVSDGTGRGNLTAIRIAAQPGFDRVVFEFDGAIPGYDVHYIDRPAIMDGSGEPVAVAGGAILQARFYPASSYDLEAGAPTHTGSRRLAGTGGAVEEVLVNGDFEAVLRWAIGTNPGALPFTVFALSDPSRIVIDVAR